MAGDSFVPVRAKEVFAFCNLNPRTILRGLGIRVSKRSWDFKGMADSFDSGVPIGAKAPCRRRFPERYCLVQDLLREDAIFTLRSFVERELEKRHGIEPGEGLIQ